MKFKNFIQEQYYKVTVVNKYGSKDVFITSEKYKVGDKVSGTTYVVDVKPATLREVNIWKKGYQIK